MLHFECFHLCEYVYNVYLCVFTRVAKGPSRVLFFKVYHFETGSFAVGCYIHTPGQLVCDF